MDDPILTIEDFNIHGDRVKLEVWLRKHEMNQILHAQKLRNLIKEVYNKRKKENPSDRWCDIFEELMGGISDPIIQSLIEKKNDL